MTVRRRLVVSGRVQGVWYRETCRRRAEAAGVAGHARNLDDGRVEVVLEGDEPAVARVEAWARSGPSRARVDQVEATDEEPTGERGFVIA